MSKMVKAKWTSNIRKKFLEIEAYGNSSGFNYDKHRGCVMEGPNAEKVFEDYAVNHPAICKFKNTP
ncbi:hypothetical protein HYDPIDRAFT_33490 [Hydnomerulius pinastri MD-312]|uniref:Uncharacterized protein n=1 Tax=Hydnomerulius pinastri MD-312 TaxID=994086 RepID=A0A0C9VNB3_9AGAM|nr:hypothetical protein HYDPIDRAFT_33490 [Hydnomerulius pinastri MD-312]